MAKTKLIVAVWKEKLTHRESTQVAKQLATEVPAEDWPFEVAIAPNPISYVAVRQIVESSGMKTCAQNILWSANSGSYIGEVTSRMLLEVGCDYVIVGHSERRLHFAENDDIIAAKANEAISSGIVPIICFGETLEQRNTGATRSVVKSQLEAVFSKLDSQTAPNRMMLAYEPVWAISTWRSDAPLPSGSSIQGLHEMVRQVVASIKGTQFSERISILYGGSVNEFNGAEYLSQPDIDGALVGGASITAESFLATMRSARAGFRKG